MNIGWVGLGSIGTHMVRHVLAAGFAVTAYARGQGLQAVQSAGAASDADYTAVAADKDVVVLCVFDDAQVASVLFEHGALAAMRPGSILVIHTTGSPGFARLVQSRAPDGVLVLDATFSGGPAQAEAGALRLIVGGPAEAIERARPVLDAYSQRIFHVGELGQGQAIKLLNNLLFAANLQNAAEILRMAEQQGISVGVCAEILHDCSASSTAVSLFKAGAPVDAVLASARPYMVKDVALALASAAELNIDTNALAATAAYFAK
jgi:3-hydroxyisobutyrate dehydrogenase-like beta-hydroxyacid dehydrogenase